MIGLEDPGRSQDVQGMILKHAGHAHLMVSQTFQSSDALSSAEGYSWTKKPGQGPSLIRPCFTVTISETCPEDSKMMGPKKAQVRYVFMTDCIHS